MTYFDIPDIVLPPGHRSAPFRIKDKAVTVKFDKKDGTHEDYIAWQIWFEYEMTAEELESLNRVASVRYINWDTFIHHETGKPWTPHSCSYCKVNGRSSLRYWAGDLANRDTDFDADTPEMFIKQVISIITKGRKIYPKKKKVADYSI